MRGKYVVKVPAIPEHGIIQLLNYMMPVIVWLLKNKQRMNL